MSTTNSKKSLEEVLEERFNPVTWWLTIGGICAVVLLGMVFIPLSYLKLSRHQAENPRPYFDGKLETDLKAINRDGSEVFLKQLKDKIVVFGYQYTDCPSGCLGMAGVMQLLHGEFGERDDFHLVSISLDPEADTPEKMDKWVKEHGVDVENWWFLTGDPDRIGKYMSRYFKFFKASENTDPVLIASQGKFAHDQRLAVVDGKANIRGYYGVMNTDNGDREIERLKRELYYLFREKEGGAERPTEKP